jgi:hypothetical protein
MALPVDRILIAGAPSHTRLSAAVRPIVQLSRIACRHACQPAPRVNGPPTVSAELRPKIATLPGLPDHPNEDYAAAKGNVVVLLDGAGIKSVQTGCQHTVHWYVQHLGPALLDHASGPINLNQALRQAINDVRGLHADTCDLAQPYTPSATVIIVRVTDHVEALVLADSTLVVTHPDGGLTVLTDDRLGPLQARLIREGKTPEPGWMAPYINQPDGFWTAAANPDASDQALTRSWPSDQVMSLALLSDGAARLVDMFHHQTWPELLAIIEGQGPGACLAQVRAAEDTDRDHTQWPRTKTHDDATIALVRLV